MKDKWTWDFTEFCLNDEDFEKRTSTLKDGLSNLNTNKPIVTMFEEYYILKLEYEKLYTYAELNADIDTSSEKYKTYRRDINTIHSLLTQYLDKLNQKVIDLNLDLNTILKKYPKLKPYKMHLYDLIRYKGYRTMNENISFLKNQIEEINTLYNTIMNVELNYNKLTINGEEIQIDAKTYSKLIKTENGDIRKQVFQAFIDALKNSNKSISELLIMRLKTCHHLARLRGNKTVLEEVINEDDLKMSIIDNLIKVVNDNLDLLKRYIKLKKEKMNLAEIKFYDLSYNLTDIDFKRDIDSAVKDIKNALNILGKDYISKLDYTLNSNCIDAYSRKHKVSGGYNFRNYVKPMILMNYAPRFTSVTTLAHELGHAVNSLMIKEKQTYQNFHFSVFLSETASLTNELLIEDYYMKENNKLRPFILENKITSFINNVFYNTMLLEFERELYKLIEEDNSINADIINNLFQKLLIKYYGEEVIPVEMKYFWMTRVHLFYNQYRYYNFQYATGLINALKISLDVLNGNTIDYLNFLHIGGSMPPLDALKQTGIDYDNENMIGNVMIYFKDLLDEYEKEVSTNGKN